ncbi:MAG TPA: hypothetical protein VGN37_21985 [Actinocatenispora sp.]
MRRLMRIMAYIMLAVARPVPRGPPKRSPEPACRHVAGVEPTGERHLPTGGPVR